MSEYTLLDVYTDETAYIARNLIAAKQSLDNAKKLYDSARQAFLSATGLHCHYYSKEKHGAVIQVDSNTVSVEPRLKLAVFDYEKMPGVVQPHLSVTELVNLSARGKYELDGHLSAAYGSVDYGHPQTKEFLTTLGVNATVSMVVTIKFSGNK